MAYDSHDTIVAVCSPPGSSVRGAVRLSGNDALAIAGRMTAQDIGCRQPTAIEAIVHLPRVGGNGTLPLRTSLFVWPTRRSFTREPVIELHTIGSPPLLAAIVELAIAQGARLAEPGEFTLRAFLAGRIDLTQAEAVLGVVDAAGPEALATALGQLAGGLATPLAAVREDLLLLLADIEAGLDFVDEDIEFVASNEIARRLTAAAASVAALQSQLVARGYDDDLPRVVLSGRPNAGKSSLFNRLVAAFGVDADRLPAIVSPIPGATRDALQATLAVDGVRFVLCDTAGVEEHAGEDTSIDGLAQSHSAQQRSAADLRVLCIPAAEYAAAAVSDSADVVAITMCDVASIKAAGDNTVPTSSLAGTGINTLAHAILSRLTAQSPTSRTLVVPQTLQRCRASVDAAAESLATASQLHAQAAGHELLASELRGALEHLGAVAGTVSTDDVLDRVFSRFCIGK